MRSSALLRVEDRACALIDAGPDVERQLELAGTLPDALLLTHAHKDAVGGVAKLDAALRKPTPLYSHPATCRRILRDFTLRHLTLKPIEPGGSFGVGGARIRAFLVPHSLQRGFPTLGFALGRRLAYVSDVARVTSPAAREIRGIETLALDASTWFGHRIASHLGVEEALRVGARLAVGRLVLTHLGHTYPPHEEAERATRARWSALGVEQPAEVLLAHDGLTLSC